MELANEAIGKIMDFIDEVVAEIGKPKAQLPAPEVIEEIDTGCTTTSPTKSTKRCRSPETAARRGHRGGAAEGRRLLRRELSRFRKIHSRNNGRKVKKAVRRLLLVDKKRADGRAMDELRPITCEVDILPMPHGSALFTRGETQSLGVTTLGMMARTTRLWTASNSTSRRNVSYFTTTSRPTPSARCARCAAPDGAK